MSDSASFESFVLRCQGKVHDADVRSISTSFASSTSATGRPQLLTTSRDRTVALVSQASTTPDNMVSDVIFTGHEGYVVCAKVHPSVPFLNGMPAIVSGSQDKHLIFWNPQTTMVEAVLDGHDNLIKCVCVLPNGNIVSAGWDSTAIVWDGKTGEKKVEFKEHQNSILCMAIGGGGGGGGGAASSFVITGSGDKTLLRWDPETKAVQQKYVAHQDAVQAVVLMNGGCFASAGNDATIIVWDVDSGQILKRLDGHESFIYDLAFNPAANELVSVSEDRTMRVWKDWTCMQCITHPAELWCVGIMENGDVAVGDSRGFIRLWTRDLEAMASADTIERLETAVSQQSMDIRQLPDQLKNSAVTLEQLLGTAGSHEGQKKLVREDDSGTLAAYGWGAGQWSRIGTVTLPDPAKQEKKPYKGKLYDYVFDVDLQGGSLKLPYNKGDDVFQAAQMFIYDNAEQGVSQEDKEMIVKFLMEQTMDDANPAVTSASSSSSVHGAAFSEFAKEEEEMRRAGNAPTSKSFKQVMEEMQNSGATPVFSQFAKEQAELAAGGGAAAAGQSTGGGGGRSVASANTVHDTRFTDLILYKDLPADKVQQRLATLGKEEEGAAAVGAVVAYCSSDSNSTSDKMPVAAVEKLIASLEQGQRLPAIDLWRHLAAHPATDDPNRIISSSASSSNVVSDILFPTLQDQQGKDTDKIISLRALANVVATCNAGLSSVLAKASGDGGGELSNVFIACAKSTAAGVRGGAVVLMTNLCIRLTDCETDDASFFESHCEALVACITAALVYDTENVLAYLRCVATLLSHTRSSSGVERCKQAVQSHLRRFISVKKDFGDAELVRVAQLLFKFAIG